MRTTSIIADSSPDHCGGKRGQRLTSLCGFQFRAKLNRMEYRGIRYTLRAGIERGQWSVVIYPQGVETTGVKVFGTRNDAEDHARRMIMRYLQPKSRQGARPER